jgi:hypothetical protein
MSKKIHCDIFEDDYVIVKEQGLSILLRIDNAGMESEIILSKPKAEQLVEYLNQLIKELE